MRLVDSISSDAMALAEARGQKPVPCEECDGSGSVRVGSLRSDPSEDSTETCAFCGGSGLATGGCSCGYHGVLVPMYESPHESGYVLVCPTCAVRCQHPYCERTAMLAFDDDGEQYCTQHYMVERRRRWVLDRALDAKEAANETEAVAK